MKKRLLILAVAVRLIYSCSKENKTLEGTITATNIYPSTYNKLSENDLSQLKINYLKDKAASFETSLNEFGFCGGFTNPEYSEPKCQSVSRVQAIKWMMSFVQKNKAYLGVSDTSLVKISSMTYIGKTYACPTTDSLLWKIELANQVYQGLEIPYSQIYFWINTDGVYSVSGNWFPEIKIPIKETYTYEMAKASLLGRQFDFLCWSWIHFNVSKETVWVEPEKRKIIYPLAKENAIELHVVWVLQTEQFTFYVDVVTGEVVGSKMNFIC